MNLTAMTPLTRTEEGARRDRRDRRKSRRNRKKRKKKGAVGTKAATISENQDAALPLKIVCPLLREER